MKPHASGSGHNSSTASDGLRDQRGWAPADRELLFQTQDLTPLSPEGV